MRPRAVLMLATLTLAMAACGPEVSVVLGPTPFPPEALHQVDGVMMAQERPCAEFAACDLARETAIAALGVDPADVVAVHVAETTPSEGGLSTEKAVVLDLADGSRRAVVVDCGAFNNPPVTCRAQPKRTSQVLPRAERESEGMDRPDLAASGELLGISAQRSAASLAGMGRRTPARRSSTLLPTSLAVPGPSGTRSQAGRPTSRPGDEPTREGT